MLTDLPIIISQFVRWLTACMVVSITLAGLLSIIFHPYQTTGSLSAKKLSAGGTAKSITQPKLLPPYSSELGASSEPVKPRPVSPGNAYRPGHCTWYAKNKRPDLPNNLGNANTWAIRASAQGIPTGSTPKVGAIGQQGMHVVYVEQVNTDGTVLISEMNYTGYGRISQRTLPAGTFMYIY